MDARDKMVRDENGAYLGEWRRNPLCDEPANLFVRDYIGPDGRAIAQEFSEAPHMNPTDTLYVRILPAPAGEEPIICTFPDLLRDNPELFSQQEAESAARKLQQGEPVQIGGGAAAAFTLERCSIAEWQASQAAKSGSHAQPSSRSR